MDLRQIYREDVFGPRSDDFESQGQFRRLHAVYVWKNIFTLVCFYFFFITFLFVVSCCIYHAYRIVCQFIKILVI